MSELTLTILRLGLLILLWLFVFSLAGALRGALYGTRVVTRTTTPPGGPAGPAPERRRRGNARGRVRAARSPPHFHSPGRRLR